MITCLKRNVDAADLLFVKLVLLYRTSLCFVMLAVKSIRRKTNKLVSKHTKQESYRYTLRLIFHYTSARHSYIRST